MACIPRFSRFSNFTVQSKVSSFFNDNIISTISCTFRNFRLTGLTMLLVKHFLVEFTYTKKYLQDENFCNFLPTDKHCAQQVSVFGVILAHSFPAFPRIRTEYGQILSIFSPNAGQCKNNADQNNSEYGHFLRSKSFY